MSQNAKIWLALAAVAFVVALFFIFYNSSASQQLSNENTTAPNDATSQATQLVTQDSVVGTGAVAQPGDTITVNYTGKLADGTVFDTSIGRAPFTFVLGAGRVIQGWDQGLVGMKVGGSRTLIIPPTLGYGANANGPIPANSTLTFNVTLLSVQPASTSTVAPPEGAAVQ